MKICNNCGNIAQDNEIFCQACGSTLSPYSEYNEEQQPQYNSYQQNWNQNDYQQGFNNNSVQNTYQQGYSNTNFQNKPPAQQEAFQQKSTSYGQETPLQPNVSIPEAPSQAYRPNIKNQNVIHLPSEYKPIKAWGYFGYDILFSIPLIGLILLIVFACGGTTNINLRNYARSKFCLLAIGIILVVILAVITAVLFLNSPETLHSILPNK